MEKISLEKLREIEPSMKDIPDEELEYIRELIYKQAELSLECYFEDKESGKI